MTGIDARLADPEDDFREAACVPHGSRMAAAIRRATGRQS
jgi:hypothetical protein